MYSQEQFEATFRSLDTDALLERLATRELTDQAHLAAEVVLRERGIDPSELPGRLHEAKKDALRRTGVTNQCDFCSKAIMGVPIVAEGQKFCGQACHYTSRLRIAAVDVSEDEAQAKAIQLKSSPCPVCRAARTRPDMYGAEYVTSAVVFTRWKKEWRLSCHSCARSAAAWASAHCLGLGIWSLYGLLRAPIGVLYNLGEALVSLEAGPPSPRLVDHARLVLARQRMSGAAAASHGV
ncbi:hypothetical protein [Lysobacter claricitrinus]|uniref:hypothetical protein n=1 Tax=Lysobacter claricitrinus TaxID=3367728 RepID=UPI0037DA88CB